MFAAATFTLGIGDLMSIIGPIAAGTGFIIYRLTRIPIQIRESRDKHEERCANFRPSNAAPAAREASDR